MRAAFLATCLALALAAAPSSAQFKLFGQDVETTLTLPGWIPPTFLPWIDGTTTVRDRPSDVNWTMGDSAEAIWPLIESIDFLLFGQGEFRIGNWMARGGMLIADLSKSEKLRGQIQLGTGVEIDYFMGEIGYRLGDIQLHEIDSALPSLTLTTDVFAGLRYTTIEGDLNFGRGPGIGNSTDWLDASLGARVHVTASAGSPLSLTLETHIAGFGSDFTWDAKGVFNYDLTKNFRFSAGWKALYVDYNTTLSTGDFSLDLFFNGPIAELSLRF